LKRRLERALASWPYWETENKAEPFIIRPIKGGYTNRSYLVRCADSVFVVRLNNPISGILGIKRDHESIILRALAKNKLAPRLVFSPHDHSYTILEYIKGRVWTKRDLASPTQRRHLKNLVRQYQSTEVDLPAFDYANYLRSYWTHYRSINPKTAAAKQPQWRGFLYRLKHYQRSYPMKTLVHHDLIPCNIIEGVHGVKIIDWEYAGLGYGEIDDLVLDWKYRQKLPSQYNVDRKPMPMQIKFWLNQLWWKIL